MVIWQRLLRNEHICNYIMAMSIWHASAVPLHVSSFVRQQIEFLRSFELPTLTDCEPRSTLKHESESYMELRIIKGKKFTAANNRAMQLL